MPDNLIIDFDSTFISLESLDEFILNNISNSANSSELRAKIEKITNQGMEGIIDFNFSVNERLKHLSANRDSIKSFSKILKKNITNSFLSNDATIIFAPYLSNLSTSCCPTKPVPPATSILFFEKKLFISFKHSSALCKI